MNASVLYTSDGKIDRGCVPTTGPRFTEKEISKLVGGGLEMLQIENRKHKQQATFCYNKNKKLSPSAVVNRLASDCLKGFTQSPTPELFGDVLVLPYHMKPQEEVEELEDEDDELKCFECGKSMTQEEAGDVSGEELVCDECAGIEEDEEEDLDPDDWEDDLEDEDEDLDP
jgi:hypothetical protein